VNGIGLSGELWQRVAVGVGDDLVRLPPFEEVELDLGEWWEGEEEPTETGG
jgi:hypothetical protein